MTRSDPHGARDEAAAEAGPTRVASAPGGRAGPARPPGPWRLAASGLDVVLGCRDPEAAARFYVDLLGARAVPEAGPWGAACAVAFDEQVIALRTAAHRERTSPGGIYDAIGLRVVGLLVDDLDALCARLAEAGRRVADGVALPGQRPIRFAKDLDGCMLELIACDGAEPPRARVQVGLTVADAASSRRFYGATLGFAEQPPVPISRGITRHGFDVGHSTLKLWQPTRSPAPRPPDSEPGLQAVALRVASLGETLAALGARGAAPAPLADRASTRSGRLLRDPDGNTIEVLEARPGSPVV